MATKSVGLFSDYEKSRKVATAPAWRKTRAQRVDDKIGKIRQMFSGEDGENPHPMLMSDSQRREKIMSHYFPGKDPPLGVLPDDEDA